jgi:hypothetical protein
VYVAGNALPFRQNLGGHTPQPEELDLLTVHPQDLMFRIRKTDEGQTLALPVVSEGIRTVWSDDNNLSTALGEQQVVLAQLRHMPAAERSLESAIEDKRNVLLDAIRGPQYHSACLDRIVVYEPGGRRPPPGRICQ